MRRRVSALWRDLGPFSAMPRSLGFARDTRGMAGAIISAHRCGSMYRFRIATAMAVVTAMALTTLLTVNGINAWWLMLIGVFALLTYSVFRAAR